MAVPNSNFATDLASMTFQVFMRSKPTDAIFGDLVLFDALASRGRVTKKGGTKILEPLMYAKSSAVGSYKGYDVLDISPQTGFTNAEFDWKQYFGSVSISLEEILKNAGEAQMLDLLEGKIRQMQMSWADRMDKDIFLDGTGNGGLNLTGLDLAVDSSGTYGNIARSANSWWSSVETAVGGTLAVTGSTGMRRAYNSASLGRNRMTPNIIITTQILHEAYEATMDSGMRWTVVGEQSTVFKNQNLLFRGAPLFWDGYCQSQTMYFLNTDYLRLVVMPQRDAEDGVEGSDFRTEPFMKPVNQDAQIAKAYWMGNLVGSNCRFQAKLTGVTNT